MKYISGSWFEFQHHNKAEGVYWNPQCAAFTASDWDAKIKEISEAGINKLVLMAVALDYKAFYDSALLPKFELACENPLDIVLAAGEKYGVDFFIGNGFWGKWDDLAILEDHEAAARRDAAFEEIVARFGNYKSFYGWYWPNEAEINPHYTERFIEYVNRSSEVARALTPGRKIMIAPYGTNKVQGDLTYLKQLEKLDVDIVAYQDEIGVRKTRVEELERIWETVRIAHDKVQRSVVWADVEIFEFTGDVYKSALVPASFDRVRRQLEIAGQYVEGIAVYQYQGMLNAPDAGIIAGHRDATRLHQEYMEWRNSR
jgi:hypothetical protein